MTGEQKWDSQPGVVGFSFLNVFKRKEDWLHFRDEIWLKEGRAVEGGHDSGHVCTVVTDITFPERWVLPCKMRGAEKVQHGPGLQREDAQEVWRMCTPPAPACVSGWAGGGMDTTAPSWSLGAGPHAETLALPSLCILSRPAVSLSWGPCPRQRQQVARGAGRGQAWLAQEDSALLFKWKCADHMGCSKAAL